MKVTVLGEALIDYTPAGYSDNNYPLFEANPGGSAANFACTLAKMGVETTFVGKLGADSQGAFLAKEMAKQNVDVTAVVFDEEVYTTLAFVYLFENGERDFSFARKPGADTCLRRDEVQERCLKNIQLLHFCSLALNSDPMRSTAYSVLEDVKKDGVIVSYDANYRAFLWSSELSYKSYSLKAISYADIVKVSEEEAEILTDKKDYKEAATVLRNMGVKIVCVTRGEEGGYIQTQEGEVDLKPYKVEKVVDTTGAGDCFFGAFISQLLQCKEPLETSLVVLKDIGHFASAAASLCVSKRGGIPSLPNKDEVKAVILPGHDITTDLQ